MIVLVLVVAVMVVLLWHDGGSGMFMVMVLWYGDGNGYADGSSSDLCLQ